MKPDPKLRRNGLCALGGCKNKRPAPAVKERDAFCSSSCCREFHGCPVPAGGDPGGKGRGKSRMSS